MNKFSRRIYLDNNIITYVRNFLKKNLPKNVKTAIEMASLVFISNIKSIDIEFLLSEESLAEIRQLPKSSIRRIFLKLDFIKKK